MLLCAALALSGCSLGLGQDRSEHGSHLQLGLIGPYPGESLSEARSTGVTSVLVEMSWASAEPNENVFDTNYLSAIAAQIAALRSAGFAIALNTGFQDAPAWLLAKPDARFVDQNGEVYTDEPLPNLVFTTSLRDYAQRYLTQVFSVLGTDFTLVRAGGGHWGELGYPSRLGAGQNIQNLYWAFDSNALAANPVPSWRPGMPSPHGEAGTFLAWYLGAMTAYQNWQITALRTAGYGGRIAMLYPSSGMRPGDFQAAVADNLDGSSSAEINGQVQRGFDVTDQIAALTDPRVVVYSTWGENIPVVRYVAGLARQHGLQVMAENAGADPAPVMTAALRNAAELGLDAFYLVRAEFLLDGDGSATFSDVAGVYQWLP